MTVPPALLTNQAFWIVTRASGVVALSLLFLSAVMGIAIRSGALDALMVRWDVNDLHRYVSWLGLGFLVVHVASLLGDRFVGFTLADVLVPFRSPYAEPWTGAGVVAFYLFAAVQVTAYLTRRIAFDWWQAWHRLSYVALPLVVVHVLGTGTDRRALWMVLTLGASVLALALALAHRRRRAAGAGGVRPRAASARPGSTR